MEIPANVKDDFVNFQQLQQKLQNLMLQKQNLQIQKVEVENALKEISTLKAGEDVFEIVGTVMLKRTKSELNTSLKDRQEIYELRMSSFNKEISKLSQEIRELQGKITKELEKKKE